MADAAVRMHDAIRIFFASIRLTGGRRRLLDMEEAQALGAAADAWSDQGPSRGPDEAGAILAAIAELRMEMKIMSASQDTVALEIVDLKANLAGLHTGLAGIQSRLDAAIAAGTGSADQAAVTDLQAINADLAAMVATLAPTPATTGTGAAPAAA